MSTVLYSALVWRWKQEISSLNRDIIDSVKRVDVQAAAWVRLRSTMKVQKKVQNQGAHRKQKWAEKDPADPYFWWKSEIKL